MKGRKHSPVQIIRKLREADRLLAEGKTTAEVAKTLELYGENGVLAIGTVAIFELARDVVAEAVTQNDARALLRGAVGALFIQCGSYPTRCSQLQPMGT